MWLGFFTSSTQWKEPLKADCERRLRGYQVDQGNDSRVQSDLDQLYNELSVVNQKIAGLGNVSKNREEYEKMAASRNKIEQNITKWNSKLETLKSAQNQETVKRNRLRKEIEEILNTMNMPQLKLLSEAIWIIATSRQASGNSFGAPLMNNTAVLKGSSSRLDIKSGLPATNDTPVLKGDENEEKIREARERREEYKKETNRMQQERLANYRNCLTILLECLKLKYRFSEAENQLANWLDSLHKSIAASKEQFLHFDTTCRYGHGYKRDEDEIEDLHSSTLSAYDMINDAWYTVFDLSKTNPDRFFLRILLKEFKTINDKLYHILGAIDDFRIHKGAATAIYDLFGKLDAFEVPTTAKLRTMSTRANPADFQSFPVPLNYWKDSQATPICPKNESLSIYHDGSGMKSDTPTASSGPTQTNNKINLPKNTQNEDEDLKESEERIKKLKMKHQEKAEKMDRENEAKIQEARKRREEFKEETERLQKERLENHRNPK